MESKVIREKFLRFFEDKKHKIVSSAPIVVQNDPTLMFTNAGMNQFKDFFLGNKSAEFKRIADTQKCLRVSGKHNDLEEVGFDTYHHTMFEMLGNWSFGNYFKKEAISWAWELLTKEFGLPENRMYATVFEGDKAENLAADDESKTYWAEIIPKDRILNGSKSDNFWEMGDTGPCGPCSEIHIDLRPQNKVEEVPGHELVNKDHPQVVEIWNLVFIEFNRLSDNSLENLPEKHVDTGMGLERLVMAIQGEQSNYDTDLFQPLIKEIAKKANVRYGENEKTDIAIRVISDHIRAISFTIADGQIPGNAKAGYVVRRILRRAVRYGYTFLSFNEPFLFELVPILADQFVDVFPELASQKEFVSKVIHEEEVSFLRTLENGLKRFDLLKRQSKNGVINGKSVFELFDTYGFPVDLTTLIAKENNLRVDIKEFEAEMSKQKERSKSAASQDKGDWADVVATDDHSQFIGYGHLSSESSIVNYREVREKNKTYFQIVLDRTPFYAESGGQVGDTGYFKQGEKSVRIFDTKKENELIVHYADKLPDNAADPVSTLVDGERRKLIMNNHSATHLAHAALKSVLGDHVQQRGSLVNEHHFRFDFSHFSKMTDEEIEKVEKIVNTKIRENIPLEEQRNVPIDEAKAMGATALFGEKYGDFVRVISFDKNYSVELCGGTHVQATGQIGQFKIISESSIAAGVRRIEAITAEKTEDYINKRLVLLDQVNTLLKHPKDLLKTLDDLIREKQKLSKELEEINKERSKGIKQDIVDSKEMIGEITTIFFSGKFTSNDVIKQIAFDLKNEVKNLLLVIGGDVQGKPNLTVMISENLVKEKDLNASNLVREMARSIKGGGGGQPFFATAGGKDVNGLKDALQTGRALILESLGVSV